MNKNEIGQAVAERRATLDITQERLAKLCGLSVHTVSNLETGTGNVTLETLLKVADILGYAVKLVKSQEATSVRVLTTSERRKTL